MFLCKDCHPGSCVSTFLRGFSSFGQCENCLKSGGCVDCHNRLCKLASPKKKRKPRRRAKA